MSQRCLQGLPFRLRDTSGEGEFSVDLKVPNGFSMGLRTKSLPPEKRRAVRLVLNRLKQERFFEDT